MKKTKEYIKLASVKGMRLMQVDARPNPLNDDTFICKGKDRKDWRVVDRATGLAISYGETMKEAIRRFSDRSTAYILYRNENPHYKELVAQFNELRKEVENGQHQ